MKKVGPVLEEYGSSDKYKGQFIAAGYGSHGMPRLHGSFSNIFTQISISQLINAYQCPSHCSNGRQRDFWYGIEHLLLATEATGRIKCGN